jgi:ParB family chromosome partitioning protein
MKAMPEEVRLISISAIRVINPRVRDKTKFELIVRNIEAVGLKRPITVTARPRQDGNEPQFDLACGQGRLEAFIALGQTQIPALVRGFDQEEGLLASLVENIARRRVRAIDQIQAIKWMRDQGQSFQEISQRTGLGEPYVADIIGLLERGEERLLDAVLHERIPVTIATKIAESPDADSQKNPDGSIRAQGGDAAHTQRLSRCDAPAQILRPDVFEPPARSKAAQHGR